MAFDTEGFLAWLPTHGVSRGRDYVHSLGQLEASHHWNLDALLPAGFGAANAQLTQEINDMPAATQAQQRQKKRLGNWRSSFRKYQAYLLDSARR